MITLGVFSALELQSNGLTGTGYDQDIENEFNRGNYNPDSKNNSKGGMTGDKDADERRLNIRKGVETETSGGMFEEQGLDAGDQFMAVKPWEGTVRNSVPTDYKPAKGDDL